MYAALCLLHWQKRGPLEQQRGAAGAEQRDKRAESRDQRRRPGQQQQQQQRRLLRGRKEHQEVWVYGLISVACRLAGRRVHSSTLALALLGPLVGWTAAPLTDTGRAESVRAGSVQGQVRVGMVCGVFLLLLLLSCKCMCNQPGPCANAKPCVTRRRTRHEGDARKHTPSPVAGAGPNAG